MDTTCKPCTDFWRYVNGGWLDKNPIPADKSSYGPFTVLADANRERIRTILDAAAVDRSAKPGSDQRKMGDLYASCMDTAAIEARGLTPVQSDFDRISAVKSAGDLSTGLAAFQLVPKPTYATVNGAVVGPFRVFSERDAKNPSRVIARIVERERPGGSGSSVLSLPDRD
jgi:putative endopeptidase